MSSPINVDKQTYSIPRRFRVFENMHIVFWLIKDMSWALKFRSLGVAMFIPTLLLALLITWQTRNIRSELYHNLAVTCWIIANGFWMICEFFWEDQDYLRYFTAIPFSLGLLFVVYYYVSELSQRRKSSAEDEEASAVEAGE
jgi:prepilin signal peptidase PulO-like enzyme (type II secretory pathway)